MFQRKIYDQMRAWKEKRQGRTALLVEGQRRVGKSTVVEAFARNEYKSYILLDFSAAAKEVRALFEDVSDLDYLFLQLQLRMGVRLFERDSAVIFDEVQLCPLARQAIKALVKDRRYDYIETGSLLSIKKNVKDILIPSEETRIPMYPMDFEEFLWAQGDMATIPLLRELYEKKRPAGEAAHRKLLRSFRLYMLVGGMPQAVSAYRETKQFEEVDQIKRDILDLYEEDFHKIDGTGRLSQLFDAIPAQLNKKSSRYAVSGVLPHLRPGRSANRLSELLDSCTVLAAYQANEPSAGLSFTQDMKRFKLFLSDTGLFVTLAFKDKAFTDNTIYRKLWSDKFPANLGYLYENAVAQALTAAGHRLYYHAFHQPSTSHRYEIDFLIARKSKICPLEIKSSGYKRHASLDAFGQKYARHIAEKYLIYTKDLQREGEVLCLPVYMTPFL